MKSLNSTLHIPILSEQQLIKGCLTGKADYQRMLYDTYASTMFGICLRYAKDYHQAEDFLQEGFIKIFNKIDQYRGEGSFEGWMKRVFVNTSIEALRKHRSFIHLQQTTHSLESTFDNSILSNLAVKDLLKYIQLLPDGYRTVFNFYIIEGYTHGEIAQLLSISEGTSKSQLSRARSALQSLIVKNEK